MQQMAMAHEQQIAKLKAQLAAFGIHPDKDGATNVFVPDLANSVGDKGPTHTKTSCAMSTGL